MSSTVARSSSPRASYPAKTHSDRAMPSPRSALPVAADDGLKTAKKQFNQPLSQLQAIFPEWKEDDLLSVLEEVQDNVELAVARISEGHAEQWGDVKHKKDKKAPTTATDKRTPAASPARGGWNLRGGRGGLGGSRARGGAHGGGRGGSGHQNFTNGHQASSRGKQSYDSGKHSTTATVLTTNGDAPKDTNVVAPVSVEGVADGLSHPTHPTSNTSTETPGTADPCGTTDTAPTTSDPPKSAASPPAPRKVPGATGMSWAQIAKPVSKPTRPSAPLQQAPILTAAPPSTSSVPPPPLLVADPALEPPSTEWENPATIQEPSWDDDPAATATTEPKEEPGRETMNGWVPAQPEPLVEAPPALAPPPTESVPAPTPVPAPPAPEPKSEPAPPVAPVILPTPSIPDTISPPPGLATPGTPSSVTASTKSYNRPTFSAAHRNSARFKDQAVILPGNSPSSLSGISFGGRNAAYDKLPVQFGSLTFGGDDTDTTSEAKPEPAPPTEAPAPEPPTALVYAPAPTSSAPGLAHPQQQQQQQQQQQEPTPPASGPSVTAPASNGFQPLQLPTQPATTSPSHPTSLSHASQSATSLGSSHTSAASVTQSLGVSGPASSLSSLPTSLPGQAQTGLSSLGQQPQPSHGLGHAHQQSYGQNNFHQPQQPSQPQQPHPQSYETVNIPGLGGGIGGFGHQGPQSQNFRHQESPFYGQQAQEPNSGYGAGGIGSGGFTPLGHQSQGSFGGPGISGDFSGYDGQRGLYDNYNGQGTFSGRNMLVHDDVKGLGGLSSHQGNQGGPGGGNQNQYPSMNAPMGNPYSYYPYYMQNQYYGAPSPAGYGHQPPFVKYPMYGQHQAGSGVQTPPNKPPATGNGNGTPYSSGTSHLHHPQSSAAGGFGDETGGYQGSASGLGGDFQKFNQGGGIGFLGTMGGAGSGSAGVGGVGSGVGPISSQRGTGTSPESAYKGYGAPGVGVGADKAGMSNVASRGVGSVGLGGAGGQGGQQGNYYQGSGAGGVAGGAGRFGVPNQYGAQAQQQPGADSYYGAGYQNQRFGGWQ